MKKIFILSSLIAVTLATPSFAEPTELDKKTVASKAYVDTKQDKIETGLVEFDDYGTTAAVPALVLTNAAGTALNGNTIGFLDLNTYNNLNSGLDELPDTMVPSIGLLHIVEEGIWNNMTALSWVVNNDNGANRTNAINAYNTEFGTGTNQWAGNSDHWINGGFLANSLALKQNKLPAKYISTASVTQMGAKGGQTIELNTAGNVNRRYITAGGNEALTLKSRADNVILYVNGTKTVEEFQTSNFGGTGDVVTTGQNYIKGALVSLELLKDVYSELNTKITNALPAGTAGNVVTYSGTAGTASSRGVYNDPSSEYFDNPNINDNELITVNAAAAIVDYVDARTPEITCAGVEPGTNECWLWTIPTYTTTTRPLPRGDGRKDVWVTGYTSKSSCIGAIRQNTSITGLADANAAVTNAPTRVATGLGPTAASNLVSTLVSGGCTAEIRNP